VPGISRDLSETIGPIVAAPGEYFDSSVPEMDLDPVTVELDLMHPALARRHLVNRSCQSGFDKAGDGGLDATGWRLWPGVGHRSGEAQCELAIRAEVAVDERLDRQRQLLAGEIETAHYFARDILRGIFGPMFCGIECDDSRVTVLARHQIADGAFEIGLAEISVYEGRTELSVIVDDEIKILIVTAWHNRRDKAPVHKNSHRQQTRRI
jgi:hypothetical protein